MTKSISGFLLGLAALSLLVMAVDVRASRTEPVVPGNPVSMYPTRDGRAGMPQPIPAPVPGTDRSNR